MNYPSSVIDDIRRENDIVSLISSYIKLVQKGNSYFGLCPFHNEQTPSFSVNPDGQYYHCFGCGASGNSIGFVMAQENLDFISALKFLADRINYKLPENDYDKSYVEKQKNKDKILDLHLYAARYFYSCLNSPEGKPAYDYLINRKILPKTIKKFGLGYSLKSWNGLYKYLLENNFDLETILQSGLVIKSKNKQNTYFDRFINRLMFPIFDAFGKVVGFGGRLIDESSGAKYLNSPETLIFDKSKNLYSINFSRKAKTKEVILVEGYIDVISLYQSGIINSVACLGTAFNKNHANLLKKFFDKVIILFDSDEAGINAALRSIPILVSAGLTIKIVELNGAKDPDEFIKKYGLKKFLQVMNEGLDNISFQIKILSRRYDLTKAQEKSVFIKEVIKILSPLSDIDKSIYLYEINRLTGVDAKLVAKDLKQTETKINETNTAKIINRNISVDVMKKGFYSSQIFLLSLLCKDINIYNSIKKFIFPEEFTEGIYQNVVSKIYNLYEQKNDVSISGLLTYFDDKKDQNFLIDAFENSFFFQNPTELEKAINDSMKVIKEYNLEQKRINNSIDLIEYSSSKINIRNLNITLIDG